MQEHLCSNAQVPLSKVPHIGPCNDLATHQGVDLPLPWWYPPCDPRGEKAVQDKKKDMVIMANCMCVCVWEEKCCPWSQSKES